MIPVTKSDAAESGSQKEAFPLTEILEKLNIACEDDRHGFTDSRKSDRIDRLLRIPGSESYTTASLQKYIRRIRSLQCGERTA